MKERLKFYFTNPLFYITAVLFTIFVNVNFFIRLQFFNGAGSTDLVLFFSSVPYISILVIPALCYKLSFAIYDDFIPMHYLKKILQNFGVILILFVILILSLVPSCFLINNFGQIDYGQLFTSIISLIFYGASVITLCLFINEIFSNSISGFIVSAILLALINTAHLFSVYVNFPDFISSFFKQISFAWHFDSAGKGIFDTRDILSFLISSGIFIYLTYLVHLFKAGKKFTATEKINYGICGLVLILLLLNSTRFFFKIDFSKNKTYSLSKYSKELINRIDDSYKITYYRSGNLSKLYPQVRDVTDFLSIYKAQNKNISFSIKNPDKDSKMKEMLNSYGIFSNQIQSVKNNSKELIEVYSAIVMEYKGHTEVIPFILSAETLEYDLAGRTKFLISNQYRVVNLILGNGLSYSSENGYPYLIPWLNSQGFICNPLYPQTPDFIASLEASDGPLLVIGDGDLLIDDAVAIENYVLSGKGNALFAVSPYYVDISNDWSLKANKHTNIVEILENWGVLFTNKIAADISCSAITMISDTEDLSNANVSPYSKTINYPLWINVMPQENCKSGITLFWPVKLEMEENAEPFLYTSSAGFTYEITKNNNSGSLIETNPFILENSGYANKERGTQIIGARITGQLKGLFNFNSCDNADVIVLPDSYFVNTLTNGYNGSDFKNFEYLTNLLLELGGEKELAELHSKNSRDTSLFKIYDYNQFYNLRTVSFILIFGIIPGFYLILFIILMIIRRKTYGLAKYATDLKGGNYEK